VEKPFCYHHTYSVSDDARILEKWIREMVSTVKNVIISMYDFCTGAHVGPGAIAVFYYGIQRESKSK